MPLARRVFYLESPLIFPPPPFPPVASLYLEDSGSTLIVIFGQGIALFLRADTIELLRSYCELLKFFEVGMARPPAP